MKKRILCLLMAVFLLPGLIAIPAGAAVLENSGEVQTIRALGIMTGDSAGNLNLGGFVTRAQFAKMLVNASSYKDSVGDGEGVSLFKDVNSTHWASQYIKIAVNEGWMTGYTDGTFRPSQSITLEQACATVLRLLGYDSSALAGSFPSAQLSKASSLGLRDQISIGKGAYMTRSDCVYLFYNALTAQTNDAKIYAVTLGYTVTNGNVDYAAVVSANLSGPYVATSGGNLLELPFASSAASVYRNGATSSMSAVQQYDVYYYNAGMQTVWIYTDRAGGTITALLPSAAAPTSVTVGTKTYPVGNATAAYKLSSMGGFKVGDTALLLLGMNGEVVDVVNGSVANTVYYGVVTAVADASSSGSTAATEVRVSVACTDGVVHTFSVGKRGAYTVGSLVSASMTDSGASVTQLTPKALSGAINREGTKLGDKLFAGDVQILDTASNGAWAKIYPSRLAGYTLSTDNIRYYVTNTSGEITHLLLDDVTGDTWSYYYLTSVPKISDGTLSGSYSGLKDGATVTLNNNGKTFGVEAGGVGVQFNSDGEIKSMRTLQSVILNSLSSVSAMGGNTTYTLNSGVQVYLRKRDANFVLNYYQVDLGSINSSDYKLTGWVDNFGSTAGKQVRVIIAEET
ncbi:S-layer homology domain-containing protein [Oscillibacter sp.]|uniref:S-layer homology domain-containing protein n=1 Tax=Oscillibacter sp. TaxID=1945593 RepID=UPI0028A5A943|nr:S-layer homology domain-containing protein [Oscillibacter sp.]